MFIVADFADGGATIDMHFAHFAGLQAQAGIHPSRAANCADAPALRAICPPLRLQFDVVHRAADRYMPYGMALPALIGASEPERISSRPSRLGRQNVAALTVL